MNTTATCGHAEALVTATGMATETGRIAHMLHEAEPEPTPLQRQTDRLGRTLALIAGIVIIVLFVLGLVRGYDLHEQFVSAVSLFRRHPGRATGGRRLHPGHGCKPPRQARRHRQTARGSGNPRQHLPDLHGQDRYIDAQPDDRAGEEDGQ